MMLGLEEFVDVFLAQKNYFSNYQHILRVKEILFRPLQNCENEINPYVRPYTTF